MTITEPAPVKLTEAPITSIQPGGGTCMSIELMWGRMRRAMLRLFRRGYVQRMASARKRECRCGHDIIDSRDLKYYQNVCTCSFRPEDDHFAGRDKIPFARPGLGELVIFSVIHTVLLALAIILAVNIHPAFWGMALVVALLWLFVISFFRDPEREAPDDPAALISPADGTITHVDEVDEPDFPGGRAFRISIFLSVFNVHVNRLPRNGRVMGARYFPGKFLDARTEGCDRLNEQLWVDLAEDSNGHWLRIKQISGAIARRIVCTIRPGQMVKRGERMGMIKFGSRTEIYLPVHTPMEVLVKPGDKVRGGSTVLLRYTFEGSDS